MFRYQVLFCKKSVHVTAMLDHAMLDHAMREQRPMSALRTLPKIGAASLFLLDRYLYWLCCHH